MEEENTFKVTFHKYEMQREGFSFPLFVTYFSLTIKPEFTFVSHQGMLLTSAV